MQNNEKLIQFHQAIQGNSTHDFNFQLGDLDQPQSRQSVPKGLAKNKSAVESFLESIDSLTFDLMKKYLSDNKDFLDKPVPPKIALYEDIKIIYEFKRGEEQIILNKGKAREVISDKLALGLRRSKATILDRMKKKLHKLTTEEIQQAIMTNTPFNFDKKDSRSKSTVPSVVNSRVDRQENKIGKSKDDVLAISEEDEIARLGVGLVKNQVKHEQKREQYGLSDLINDWDMCIATEAKKRIYKYGNPDLKQKIFVFADRKKNKKVFVTESQAADIRKRMDQKEKMKIEELKMKTSEQHKDTDQEWKDQEQAPMPKKEDNQGVKVEEYEIVEKIESKQEETHHQEVNIPKEKQEQKEQPKTFSFMQKSILSPIPEPPKKEQNYQQEYKKLLYKLNNNEQHLQRLCKDPKLKEELIWSQEEDGILYQFCFNAECDKLGITCLFRYKRFDYVIERFNFLSLEIDSKALTQLKRLAGRLDEPMDIV